uniref:Retinol binding protein 3 n=1 Tax=Sinocyclocheilus grahami TaxID=75366 RepID=A0A672M1Q5_SINGR
STEVLLIDASFQPALVLDMAKILLENYCFPGNLGMQEAIQQAISSREILHISDRKTLAAVAVQGALNDPRLTVFYEPNYIPITPPALQSLPTEQLMRLIRNIVKLELKDNNIGYLRIDRIIGQETAAKLGRLLQENIWKKVAHTSEMIFDFAVTGELSGIPYIVSYYTDPEPLIHIDSVYDRTSDITIELWSMPTLLGKRYGTSKPLIILTSKNTLGIAEDVAYCLKNLKRATIVGENTAGGSIKINKIKVGDTDFYVTVPVAKSMNPITGKSWEVNGVAPDVEVTAEDALDAAIAIIKLRAAGLVQGAATLVADNYAFPSIGDDVAEKLGAVAASGEYNLISTKEELEAKLSADLLKLSGDKCLKATSNIPALPPKNPTPEMFIELIKVSFHTDVFENNIGYLRFDMFGDFEHVAKIIAEHVWNKVVDTGALIIDLRNNVGGSTSSIAGFCSYFFDGDKQIVLDHSVIILTSGATAGAAEEFVFIMKKLGRAMIIGETTHGGCHPPETFSVGESDIFLSIPISHSDTAQGPSWEGAGIAPHIPVPADAALDTAKGILNKHFSGQQ